MADEEDDKPGWRKRLGAATRSAASAIGAIAAYALPPRCPGCGVIVAGDRQFCLPCWHSLDFLSGPACAACSVPLPVTAAHLVPDPERRCGACLADPPPFDGAPAAIAYGPAARRIALRLKYARRLGHARLMADMMARPLAMLCDARGTGRGDGAAPLLVPVPLHRWRLWARGFNQSGLIARALAQSSGADLADDILLRHRATPSLRGLGAKQRDRAVRGAFALAPTASVRLAGRHAIIIDDVHASGATLRACARLLRRGGAARVSALSFARVVPGAAEGQAFDFAAIDSDMNDVLGVVRP
jgi:ComF family protein